jgi:hypothetical protein
LKKFVIILLKFGVSLGILAYLFHQASKDESFSTLLSQRKDWWMLACAFAVALAGVSNNMVRWYLLVRALDMPFSLKEAFRLGFIGYLFNLMAFGLVGGDALKAVFLAQRQKGRRTHAVATVLVDRVVGLYALLMLAAVAFLAFDLESLHVRDPVALATVHRLGQLALALTIAGTAGIALLLLPGFTTWPVWDALVELPRVGSTFQRIIEALRIYRRRVGVLFLTCLMSLGTHALLVLAIYFVASGLFAQHPSLATHCVIVPISMTANALPIGVFEAVLDLLYRAVSAGAVPKSQGFVVALGFRLITILIGVVGVIYYLSARRQVADLVKEAEVEEQHEQQEIEQQRLTESHGPSISN